MRGKPTLVVVAAVIEREGAFLVARRQPGVHLEGHWEFPGGKPHPGEDDADAVRRELREELDVDADVGAKEFTTLHEYDDRIVQLHFYRCRITGTPKPMLGQILRWVPRTELSGLRFPPADAELIARLTTGAGGGR